MKIHLGLMQVRSIFTQKAILAGVLTSVLMAGCAAPGKRTVIGAGAGTAAGAAIGGLAGGWKGAGIGAAIGALAGGSVGNYLDKQANELAEVVETHRTAEGILVNLRNDLLFSTGSSVLKPGAVAEISRVGDILSKYPEDRIRISGHTDNVGQLALNELLSLQRAEAVKAVLQSRGVKEQQILTFGYGPAHPVADNKSSQGRSKNRRVELSIDFKNG